MARDFIQRSLAWAGGHYLGKNKGCSCGISRGRCVLEPSAASSEAQLMS